MSSSWGRFLDCKEWQYMFTFTFRKETGGDFALQAFTKFRKYLEKVLGHRVQFFVVAEDGAMPGGSPLHGLLAGVDSLTTSELAAMWQFGFSRVTRYDSGRGGAYYVTKSMDDDEAAYLLSDRLRLKLPARTPRDLDRTPNSPTGVGGSPNRR